MLGKSKGINTYGLRISDSSFDESPYQRLMAEYGQTNHHEIVVDCATVMNNLQEHMAFIDEPYGHGAALPSFLLAKAAKQDVKVLLSGEGGDEIFNAYDTYGAYKWRKLYRQLTPSLLRKLMRASANALPTSHKKLSLDFKLKRFLAGSIVNSLLFAINIFVRHRRRSFLFSIGSKSIACGENIAT